MTAATGNFAESGPLLRIPASNARVNSMASSRIPYATEQGISKCVSGNFFRRTGKSSPTTAIEQDYDSRPIYDLSEQLSLFDRRAGPSKADQWHTALAEYLHSTGTIATIPNANNYLTDEFLKRIEADPKLRGFANGE